MNYQSKFAEQNNLIPFVADETLGRHGIKLVGIIDPNFLKMEATITVSAAGIWMSKAKEAGPDCFCGDEGLDRLCETLFISCGAPTKEIRVHPETLREIESGQRTIIPEGQR